MNRRDMIGRPMEILLVEDNRMDAHFAIHAVILNQEDFHRTANHFSSHKFASTQKQPPPAPQFWHPLV
jgi:hypothetical protein